MDVDDAYRSDVMLNKINPMKIKFVIIISFLLIACNVSDSNELKILDTGLFEIQTPSNWKYKEKKGIDSQTGIIIGSNIKLDFDWSEMGYANNLIQAKDEFLLSQKNNWLPGPIPYGEEGVTYVLKESIENTRKELIKKYGSNDTTKIRVEELQVPINEVLLEKDEYFLVSKYRDTTTRTKFEIPAEIMNHEIDYDTISHYVRKTVKSINVDIGITGIYIEDLKSDFNFNLVGYNLSKENQNAAIEAFKTIKMKR